MRKIFLIILILSLLVTPVFASVETNVQNKIVNTKVINANNSYLILQKT